MPILCKNRNINLILTNMETEDIKIDSTEKEKS